MGSDERMSAALLDRLTHRATILEFVGTSFRFRQQLQRQEVPIHTVTASGETDEEELAHISIVK